MGFEVLGDNDSPVMPIMLYNPAKIPAFSRECLRKHVVVTVAFPTTPRLLARARIYISASHSMEDRIKGLEGPVHAYVAVPRNKTSYLSELRSGREVIVVDQNGLWRAAIVDRVKIASRPLILVEAKENSRGDTYSIFLKNAETVGLITPDRDTCDIWIMKYAMFGTLLTLMISALLAVCPVDGHVKLYRPPICEFCDEWVERFEDPPGSRLYTEKEASW